MDERVLLFIGLTRYNYFPNQKEGVPEIPPCITSRQFTPYVAKEIASHGKSGIGNLGRDSLSYNLTRFNNASRILSLIHPHAYSRIATFLSENWHDIKPHLENENSLIKPSFHADGRIMIMNYEAGISQVSRHSKKSFGKKFIVKADISNCFNSVYSHSIPWAMNGVMASKSDQDNNLIHNGLDERLRFCKRNETQGIAIGPAASNIILEIILAKVDSYLSQNEFLFERYIDDYTCYCKNSDEANDFINHLSNKLSEFKMHLNGSKTKVIELPVSNSDDWVTSLLISRPKENGAGEISCLDAVNYINYAISLNNKQKDGSVLKFAISLIVNKLERDNISAIYDLVKSLSWHYPILIPFLSIIILDKLPPQVDRGWIPDDLKSDLKKLIIHNCYNNRSDGIAWCLHIYRELGVLADDDEIDEIIKNGDCISLTILNDINKENEKIIGFANSIRERDYQYDCDRYWLLLYQLFREQRIKSTSKDSTFHILRKHKVNFIPKKGDFNDDEKKIESYFSRLVFSGKGDELFDDEN